MFSTQVIGGISGGVLAFAGLLLVMSSMKQRRVDWRIGIGVPLFGLGLFILVTDLPQYALGFSILATLSMAFAAFLNIGQSADREKRDRKERVIREIVEWATEIHTTGLRTALPGIDPSLELNIEAIAKGNQKLLENIRKSILNSQYKSLEFARFFEYATAFSINVYIKALASKFFKGNDLIGIIDLVIDSLTAFMFLKGKSLGLDLRESFAGGGIPKIFDRVENELKSSSIEKVLSGYSIKLSDSINALFVQSSNIISNL